MRDEPVIQGKVAANVGENSKHMDKDANRKTKNHQSQKQEEWPLWVLLILIVVAFGAAATLIIGLPIWNAVQFARFGGNYGDAWSPMIAVLVGLTTMTISGIFVFMTFRIDRGAKLEAQQTAEKTAKKTLKELAKKTKIEIKKAKQAGDELENDARAKIDGVTKEVKQDGRKRVLSLVEELRKDAKGKVDQTAKDVFNKYTSEEYVAKQFVSLLQQTVNKEIVKEAVVRATKGMSTEELEKLIKLMEQELQSRNQPPETRQEVGNWLPKIFRRD